MSQTEEDYDADRWAPMGSPSPPLSVEEWSQNLAPGEYMVNHSIIVVFKVSGEMKWRFIDDHCVFSFNTWPARVSGAVSGLIESSGKRPKAYRVEHV